MTFRVREEASDWLTDRLADAVSYLWMNTFECDVDKNEWSRTENQEKTDA